MLQKIAPKTRKTPILPIQLISRSIPRRSAIRARTNVATSRTASAASAQRGNSSKCQQTAAPARTVSLSTTGSSSAPIREYWPVARARNPST
jgi:hypothetical protein